MLDGGNRHIVRRHIGDGDARKQPQYLRALYGAVRAPGTGWLIAFGVAFVLGKTVRQDDRTVDAADHFERGDILRRTRQTVAAGRALLGHQHAVAGQRLADFREQRQRESDNFGDLPLADAVLAKWRKAMSP